MPDYKIHIPTEAELSQIRLQAIRHPKLLALKGVQIGPAFSLPDPTRQLGQRGVPIRKTKSPFWLKKMGKEEAKKLCIIPRTDKLDYRNARRKRNQIAHESRIKNGN